MVNTLPNTEGSKRMLLLRVVTKPLGTYTICALCSAFAPQKQLATLFMPRDAFESFWRDAQ